MARHPRDYSGERRTESFTLQLSPSEKEKLRHLAREGRMAGAEFVRRRLRLTAEGMQGVVGPAPQERRRAGPWKVDAVREVNRIGVNINQIRREMHQQGRVPQAAVLQAIAAEIKTALTKLV
jgi:hypothetical protein